MNSETTQPKVHDAGVIEAHQAACAGHEPVFVPAQVFTDDRGWSIMNQLHGVMGPQGQLNFSVMYPQVVKAWHCHQHQTDFWLCPLGHVKVGVYRENDGKSWMMVMGEKRPGVLIVPPMLWHGMATVGATNAAVMYYVTRAYDPASPDEQRRPYDSVEGFSWQVSHG